MSTTALKPQSVSQNAGRVTLQTLRDKKQRQEPIAMLTAYDCPTAKLLAAAGVEVLLVGDSAATTVLGADSTVAATLEALLRLELDGWVERGPDGRYRRSAARPHRDR